MNMIGNLYYITSFSVFLLLVCQGLHIIIIMNSEDEENNQDDDGFQSDNDGKLSQKAMDNDAQKFDERLHDIQENKKWQIGQDLPPGQGIISDNKKYSLFPDMATGWTPKDNKCHPIPITVDIPVLDTLYDILFKQTSRLLNSGPTQQKNSNFEMVICYFGPRYDNTYYSWYQMPFQFPYINIEPPTNMKFTNRPFNGSHPSLNILQPNTLIFDSFFENANLDCAVKVDQFQYDLYLRVDSNTRGHFQWYNFKINNMQRGVKYKFNICNLQKDESLYNRGMKPYVFSTKAKQKSDRGWHQEGENIKYEKRVSKSLVVLHNAHSHHNHNGTKCRISSYYKLSFEYSPTYQNDTIQMAYCVPYTLTNLKDYLQARRKKCENKKFYKESRLCLSLGGLPVPLITINQQAPHDEQIGNQAQGNHKIKKKCIVIGCRVHPGQSNSSYMMEGFLDFLCSNKSTAKILRSKIQFKIVPMLNPDGVCFGNYRTGLSGKDFNREYMNPDVRIFPQVYCFKKLVVQSKKKYGSNFMMFLDFHGHSVRKNVFMYGPENSIMDKYYYESRIFPRLVSKRTEMFRYYSCVFKIEQSKKTTARSIFQQIHNIPLSFTIQASNGSYYNTQILKDFPFTARKWIQMGMEIGMSLYQYLNIVITAQKARSEKYEKLNKFHAGLKEENNLRTTKLMERKKQKKKGGQKIQDFNYGRVTGYTHENDFDDDLFKYIYEQIQQNQSKRRQSIKNQESFKAFEEEENIKQGNSDNEDPEDDLEPQKLSVLYQAIKRKQYNEVNLKKSPNKDLHQSSARSQKQEGVGFKNQLLHSRIKSSFGNNQEEYCKRLSQPRKTGQVIVNLSFPDQDFCDVEPIQVMALRASKIIQNSKKNPKTFQDFVASYQKWEKKLQKDQVRPISAYYKSITGTQTTISSNVGHQRNYSSTQTTTPKSFLDELKKQKSRIGQPQTLILKKSICYGKSFQSIEQHENIHRSEKKRVYSPVRNKNIYL